MEESTCSNQGRQTRGRRRHDRGHHGVMTSNTAAEEYKGPSPSEQKRLKKRGRQHFPLTIDEEDDDCIILTREPSRTEDTTGENQCLCGHQNRVEIIFFFFNYVLLMLYAWYSELHVLPSGKLSPFKCMWNVYERLYMCLCLTKNRKPKLSII